MDTARVTEDFPVTWKLEKQSPSWKRCPAGNAISGASGNMRELPENCRKYIEFVEAHIGYPITMVSNGPGREDIIYRQSALCR